jgi:hypothetical protein
MILSANAADLYGFAAVGRDHTIKPERAKRLATAIAQE